jgi:hypothetical protein
MTKCTKLLTTNTLKNTIEKKSSLHQQLLAIKSNQTGEKNTCNNVFKNKIKNKTTHTQNHPTNKMPKISISIMQLMLKMIIARKQQQIRKG